MLKDAGTRSLYIAGFVATMIRPWKPIVGRIIQANPWSRPVSSTIQLPVPTSKYLDIIPQEQKLLIGGPPTASRSGLLLLRSNDLFLIAGILSLATQDQTVSALEACLAPQRSTRRLQKLKSVFSCLKVRQWEVTTFEHRKANTPYGEGFSFNGILMCKSTSYYHLTWTS